MDCIYDYCFVLSRWDGEMAYRRQGSACVWEEETARPLTTTSTPTQSTPTQYAGNIGAQPKDGMRGRRLSEVAVRARRSAHRPSYMDVEYTVCMYRQTLDVRVRGWQQQASVHTHTLLISLFSIWPALLSPTLGSPAKASEEPKAWGPLLTALWRRYCARSKIKI